MLGESLVKIGAALQEDPDARHFVYLLCRAAGVRSPTVYRCLTRLLDAGWVSAGWEERSASGGAATAAGTTC